MDDYDSPFGRRKATSPAPKSSFQRELEAKMRDRQRKGLAADYDSAHGSEDELGSDDELMSNFNMTNKGLSSGTKGWQAPGSRTLPMQNGRGSPFDDPRRQSPHNRNTSPYNTSSNRSPVDDIFSRKTPTKSLYNDEDNSKDELMMTMKKPWAPPGSRKTNDDKRAAPNQRRDMNDYSPGHRENKPWEPPNMRKQDSLEREYEDSRDRPQRPKSPSVRGRRTPVDLDAIEEDSEERPKPTPRSRGKFEDERPKPKPRGSRFAKEEDEEEIELRRRGRKSPATDIFGGSKPRPKTPTRESEKKSYMKGKSSENDRKSPSGKKTPEKKPKSLLDELEGDKKKPKKSRGLLKDEDSDDDTGREPGRKVGNRKSPYHDDYDRYSNKGPHDRDADRYGRRSPYEHESDRYGKKSPFDDSRDRHGQRSPFDADRHDKRGRMSEDSLDGAHDGYRSKSPFDTRIKKEQSKDSYASRRNRSVENEDDSDDYGHSKRASQFDKRREGDEERMPTKQEDRQGRKKVRAPTDDRDSSLCREVEADPGPMRKPDTDEGKDIRKKEIKSQTTENRLLNECIDHIKDAQDKADSAFKPVDPANENATTPDGGKTMKVKHRPKPRYVKPMIETFPPASSTRTTDFNSTGNIKESIYLDWFNQKQERAKKERAEKLKKEKEEEEKKAKQAVEKEMEATGSYNAWLEQKKETTTKKKKAEHKAIMKKQKEEDEKLDKQKDSEQLFKSWKENKDAYTKEQKRKKEREEERKRRAEEDKKLDKEKDSKSAFEGWKSKKDVRIKSARKEEQEKQKTKEEDEMQEKEYTEQEALEAYHNWMAKKEKQKEKDHRRQRETRLREMESPRPPFSPAGNHVIVR